MRLLLKYKAKGLPLIEHVNALHLLTLFTIVALLIAALKMANILM